MDENASNKSLSSFAGFIDGYRAGNIETLESTIDWYTLKSANQLDSLSIKIKSLNDSDLIDSFALLQKYAQDSKLDALKRTLLISETLLKVLSIIKTKKLFKKLSKTSMEQLRDIVISILEVARRTGDTEITTLAIRLGKELEKTR